MHSSILQLLSTISLVHGAAIIPRTPQGGAQTIPSKPPASFNNGAALLIGEPPNDDTPAPGVFGAREIDLPFYRLHKGNLNFFSAGQLNTPNGDTDVEPAQGGVDAANQSACGIPDSAFFVSKVAIHPYWLKYADLSRFCEQDVCISFWKEDGSSDMELKVTDICSTDPNDPTHCAHPMDIKIDRSKAKIMEKLPTAPTGDTYPAQVWWFFDKCWDDGLVQPPYKNNWFAQPALPNNLKWSQATSMEQYKNNQASYPTKGWPTYADGGYNTTRVAEAITDWVKGEEPCYTPIAGGKGWGSNICSEGQSKFHLNVVSSPSSNSSASGNVPAALGLKPASSSTAAAAQSTYTSLAQAKMMLTGQGAPGVNITTKHPAAGSGKLHIKLKHPVDEEEEQDECDTEL